MQKERYPNIWFPLIILIHLIGSVKYDQLKYNSLLVLLIVCFVFIWHTIDTQSTHLELEFCSVQNLRKDSIFVQNTECSSLSVTTQ